jgi:hypothetical protein
VDGYNVMWVLKNTVIAGSSNPKPAYPGEPLYSVALDPVVSKRVSGEMQAAYARKQIIAIHVPPDNLDAETGGTANNMTNSHPDHGSLVRRCLPTAYGGNTVDGDLCPALQGSLDSLAQLIRGDAGLGLSNLEHIPILVRPWPEWNFNAAYWWGAGQCSTAEFIALWQFTVSYLRDVKGLHDLIYVWAPSLNAAASPGNWWQRATIQWHLCRRWKHCSQGIARDLVRAGYEPHRLPCGLRSPQGLPGRGAYLRRAI